MHYVDWSGNGGTQHGHYLYDPFEDEAALLFGNHHHICPEMKKALQGVFLIAEQKKRIEESTKVSFFTKLYISKYYYGQLGHEGAYLEKFSLGRGHNCLYTTCMVELRMICILLLPNHFLCQAV
jgi:hypothetical protein